MFANRFLNEAKVKATHGLWACQNFYLQWKYTRPGRDGRKKRNRTLWVVIRQPQETQTDSLCLRSSRKYQFMEQNLQRRVAGLKDKMPDIQKTLDTVRFLKMRKVFPTCSYRDLDEECHMTPNLFYDKTGRSRAYRGQLRA